MPTAPVWLTPLALLAGAVRPQPARSTAAAPAVELRIGVVLGAGADAAAALAGAEAARAELAASAQARVTLLPFTVRSPWAGAAGPIARLIFDQHADALIETGDATLAHVAAQVATRARVPLITLSSETQLTAIHDKWVFRIAPSDREQAASVLAQATGGKRGGTARLVVPGGREGRERLASLRAACRDAGVAGTQVEDGEARAAAPLPVDVVLLWLDPEAALAWLGRRDRALASARLAGSLRLAALAASSRRRLGAYELLLPGATDGATADPAAALGYEAVRALAAASAAARSQEPEALVDALLGLTGIAGRLGRFRFGPDGGRRAAPEDRTSSPRKAPGGR